MKLLILAGGEGSRLWPLSRDNQPKQLLNLCHNSQDSSLLIDTITRCLSRSITLEDIFIVTGENLIKNISQQLHKSGIGELTKNIICEPCRKNTAPAIAFAAEYIYEKHYLCKGDVITILPADHAVNDQETFKAHLLDAEKIANNGFITTLGITPTRPEIGYGYIKAGNRLEGFGNKVCFRVEEFTEKPNFEIAAQYFEQDCYFWNSGIFTLTFESLFSSFETYCPPIYSIIKHGFKHALTHFESMPNISFDYAVMEQALNIAVIPLECSWSDLGTWDSVFEICDKDQNNNTIKTKSIHATDTLGCLVWSETNRHIVTLGLKDCIVVDTPDALLVSQRSEIHKIKEITTDQRHRIIENAIFSDSLPDMFHLQTGIKSEIDTSQPMFYLEFKENESFEIKVDNNTHWCVLHGTAILDLKNHKSIISNLMSWDQQMLENYTLRVGTQGLILIAIGGQPLIEKLSFGEQRLEYASL